MSVPKDRLYQLIDALPETATEAAEQYLEYLLSQSKNPQHEDLKKAFEVAPYDDEPLTVKEIQEIEQAKKEIEAEETISLNEVKRRLGL